MQNADDAPPYADYDMRDDITTHAFATGAPHLFTQIESDERPRHDDKIAPAAYFHAHDILAAAPDASLTYHLLARPFRVIMRMPL